MTILATLVTLLEAEQKHPTILPPIAFAIIAFLVFLVLGVITWSFRDVAHRQEPRYTSRGTQDDDHGAVHH